MSALFVRFRFATDKAWQALLGTECPCDRDVDEGNRRSYGEMWELLVRESVWESAIKVTFEKRGFAFSGTFCLLGFLKKKETSRVDGCLLEHRA